MIPKEAVLLIDILSPPPPMRIFFAQMKLDDKQREPPVLHWCYPEFAFLDIGRLKSENLCQVTLYVFFVPDNYNVLSCNTCINRCLHRFKLRSV